MKDGAGVWFGSVQLVLVLKYRVVLKVNQHVVLLTFFFFWFFGEEHKFLMWIETFIPSVLLPVHRGFLQKLKRSYRQTTCRAI